MVRKLYSNQIVSIVQGVVVYMSPVEAFAIGIKSFDQQKVCLIA